MYIYLYIYIYNQPPGYWWPSSFAHRRVNGNLFPQPTFESVCGGKILKTTKNMKLAIGIKFVTKNRVCIKKKEEMC